MLLKLFLIFLKIGLFNIGGGNAIISLIYKEIVESTHLLSDEEFFSLVTLSLVTPGAIAVNFATYLGVRFIGLWGGIITTFAVIIVPISILSFLDFLREKSKFLSYFLKNLKIIVVSLWITTLFILVNSLLNWHEAYFESFFKILLFILNFIIIKVVKLNIALTIVLSGFLYMLIF